MKKIQILGTGCAKCNKLAQAAEQMAQELNIEYELEKVTDIQDIMKFNIMMTPGLVVDGQVMASGVIPSKADLQKYLSD